MAVFIAELVGFVLILFVLWRYVLPPLRTIVTARQETVQQQVDEAEAAAQRYAEAERRLESAIADARNEAARIRDDARADATRIREELTEQAEREVERIKQRGEEQLAAQRDQLVRRLRAELAGQSMNLAERIVVQSLAVDTSKAASVDSFLDDIEGLAARGGNNQPVAPAATGDPLMAAVLQPASRESLGLAQRRLDDQIDGSSASDLTQLSNDLFAVFRLLAGETTLRRALADPSTPGASRSSLADRLLSGKISRQALDVVNDLVSARWSRAGDLVEALETLARRTLLGVAEKGGAVDRVRRAVPGIPEAGGDLDEVEDQLFRFGRVLNREPELATLLADHNTPADKRAELLRSVLGGKVSPVTETLLEQTVRTPRGRSLERAAELSELAAARRDRYIAHVRTPVRLTEAQERRLTDALTRIYGRPIALQVELDPSLLGGLVVRVGGELIDGSVAGRLAAARRTLPE